MLKEKTEKDIRRIIDSSSAVTGFMAMDLTSGETLSYNADIVFPQASAIKIPILMEVYKQANQKKFAMSDVKSLQATNIVGGSGILKDLTGPVNLSIKDLCILMIALSDNSATNTLIDLVSIPAINSSLESLGFKATRVRRKMIDAAASARGDENTSSPAEAVKILQLLYSGKVIDKTISDEILSILKKTDPAGSRLAKGLPANVGISYKPGDLTGVSTEWAIVHLSERPYAIAMMENFKVSGESAQVMENVSKVLYQYFWRIGNATKYGVYK
jgi:beta-lactamase class A